jgi:hypothetical protein
MRQYDFDKDLFSFFLSESEPIQFFIRLFLPWKVRPAEVAVICGLAVDGTEEIELSLNPPFTF